MVGMSSDHLWLQLIRGSAQTEAKAMQNPDEQELIPTIYRLLF